MGKGIHLHNGGTTRYLLNIPEIDYCILDALISSPLRRIGTQDIKDYYKQKGQTPPTAGAFSQALARMKQRGVLHIERHESLWVEFPNKQVAEAIMGAINACKRAEQAIGGMA